MKCEWNERVECKTLLLFMLKVNRYFYSQKEGIVDYKWDNYLLMDENNKLGQLIAHREKIKNST